MAKKIDMRPGESVQEALERAAAESFHRGTTTKRKEDRERSQQVPIDKPHEFKIRSMLNLHCSVMVSLDPSNDETFIFTKEKAIELEKIIKEILLKGWKTLLEELKEINPKLSVIRIRNSNREDKIFTEEGDTILISLPYHNKIKVIKEILQQIFYQYGEQFKPKEEREELPTSEEVILDANPRVNYISEIRDIYIEEPGIEEQIVLIKGQREILFAEVIHPEDINKYLWGVWDYTTKNLIFKTITNKPEFEINTDLLEIRSYNIQCLGLIDLGNNKYQKIQNQGRPIGINKRLIITTSTIKTAPVLQSPFITITNAEDPENHKSVRIKTNIIHLEVPIIHSNIKKIRSTIQIRDKKQNGIIENITVELNEGQIKANKITGEFNLKEFNKHYEIKIILEGFSETEEKVSVISSIEVFAEMPEFYEFPFKKNNLKLQLTEDAEINEKLIRSLEGIIEDGTLGQILKLNPKLKTILIGIK